MNHDLQVLFCYCHVLQSSLRLEGGEVPKLGQAPDGLCLLQVHVEDLVPIEIKHELAALLLQRLSPLVEFGLDQHVVHWEGTGIRVSALPAAAGLAPTPHRLPLGTLRGCKEALMGRRAHLEPPSLPSGRGPTGLGRCRHPPLPRKGSARTPALPPAPNSSTSMPPGGFPSSSPGAGAGGRLWDHRHLSPEVLRGGVVVPGPQGLGHWLSCPMHKPHLGQATWGTAATKGGDPGAVGAAGT